MWVQWVCLRAENSAIWKQSSSSCVSLLAEHRFITGFAAAVYSKKDLYRTSVLQTEETQDLDLLTFDNLEWEVECTAEVWKTLRDPRITQEMKQRIVRSIKFLASGEWRPQLCRKVRGRHGVSIGQYVIKWGLHSRWPFSLGWYVIKWGLHSPWPFSLGRYKIRVTQSVTLFPSSVCYKIRVTQSTLFPRSVCYQIRVT